MEMKRVDRLAKKFVAVLMMLIVFASATCMAAFAEVNGQVRQYKVYTSLGDSCGSGFGLPDYNKYGRFVQYGHRVKGAYPDLVAKAVRAKKLNQMCVPDFRTNELRFLLDSGNQGDWILQTQAWNMTLGGYNKEVLNSWRPAYQKASSPGSTPSNSTVSLTALRRARWNRNLPCMVLTSPSSEMFRHS